MTKRIVSFNDIIIMALLYRKEYTYTELLSYDKVLEFDRIIHENLKFMNPSEEKKYCQEDLYYGNDSKLFTKVKDETGKMYVYLLPNVNIEKAYREHIACYSVNVYLASVEENALEAINLIEFDGKIVQMPSKPNVLIEDTNQSFDHKKSLVLKKKML